MVRRVRLARPPWRAWITAALLASLATSAVACADGGSSSDAGGKGLTKVRFAYIPALPAEEGIMVAKRMGYFEKHGLDVEFITVGSAGAGLQLVQAGRVEYATASVDLVASARANHFDSVVTSAFSRSITGSVICRKDLHLTGDWRSKMRQLAHTKFATNAYPSTNWMAFAYTMASAGADPSTVSRVVAGSIGNSAAAVSSGNADCVALQPGPIPKDLLAQGTTETKIDFSAGDGPPQLNRMLLGVSASAASWANSNPEVVRAFNAAVEEACDFAADPANTAEVAAALAPDFPGTTAKDLTDLLALNVPTLQDVRLTPEGVDAVVEAYNVVYPDEKVGDRYGELVAQPLR